MDVRTVNESYFIGALTKLSRSGADDYRRDVNLSAGRPTRTRPSQYLAVVSPCERQVIINNWTSAGSTGAPELLHGRWTFIRNRRWTRLRTNTGNNAVDDAG